MRNLVIVESPAKAKTIASFLGSDFVVKSCFGHIRDLGKNVDAVDIAHNFKPNYEIPDDKKAVVADLRKNVKTSDMVWLASDEDREGEAIAWHLSEVLKLNKKDSKRIVFHEITKTAILEAIANPRYIDTNLVNAQQARRILDRLVGYELSAVLWKKIKPALSAGRVQSVAVRLVVEREREITAFNAQSFFKISAEFLLEDKKILIAEHPSKFSTKEDAEEFLKKCIGAKFSVKNVETKPGKRTPAPPFTTSTLQQEASRKLGFSVSRTMVLAQQLYEDGLITYMRTDSVNLSNLALDGAHKEVVSAYGEKYAQTRNYITKSKSAQEAHEAIRPTHFDRHSIRADNAQQKLYELIWRRAIASQMADAQLERTTVNIAISTVPDELVATGEVLVFDGFLKVYLEGRDEDSIEEQFGILPPLSVGQLLDLQKMDATEKFNRPPVRYTEASLVKKLEEQGIGRPSTYAPTISTIMKRGYVAKEDREGKERIYQVITLQNGKIVPSEKSEITGAEKQKLFPSDIGNVVTDFLQEHFKEIMDYQFTATVEEEFDEIAQGELEWEKMLKEFYGSFHKTVDKTLEEADRASGERVLGTDPKSGKVVKVRIGRYGPLAQLGESTDDEKARMAPLRRDQMLENITLQEALDLFKLPRIAGQFEDKEMKVAIGRFGPYILHDGKFYSLPKTEDPYTIDEKQAICVIEAKRANEALKHIKSFPEHADLEVLNGRYGPYISYQKENYKIPKEIIPSDITYEKAMELIEKAKANPKPKRPPFKKRS
ncbi:MAG TPA: type I DNA topoisomerase [Patescibacteria group bacterium]|nr:type I DNA topoisomerase [Patescibacteria group bacterium]